MTRPRPPARPGLGLLRRSRRPGQSGIDADHGGLVRDVDEITARCCARSSDTVPPPEGRAPGGVLARLAPRACSTGRRRRRPTGPGGAAGRAAARRATTVEPSAHRPAPVRQGARTPRWRGPGRGPGRDRPTPELAARRCCGTGAAGRSRRCATPATTPACPGPPCSADPGSMLSAAVRASRRRRRYAEALVDLAPRGAGRGRRCALVRPGACSTPASAGPATSPRPPPAGTPTSGRSSARPYPCLRCRELARADADPSWRLRRAAAAPRR